jgi:DNA invertase Pin-like site-specific DNA recombinase
MAKITDGENGKAVPKTVAYVRMTILDKNKEIEARKDAIVALAGSHGLGEVLFVEEKTYCKTSWSQTKIAQILENLTAGDTLLVYQLSELGQSVMEVLEALSAAAKKKIRIYSVNGKWQFTEDRTWESLDMAFSLVSEIQNDVIPRRTKEVLTAKKLAGIKLGRPEGICKLDQYTQEIQQLLASGATKESLIKRYGVARRTFYNWLKQRRVDRLQWGN